jgi:uncharacterized membrane protein (DUF373 family)
MIELWPRERVVRVSERGVLSTAQLLLIVLVLLGLMDLLYLLVRCIGADLLMIDSVGELQNAMQHGVAGIMLVLIGLELLETVRAYLEDHQVRLETVLIVAVIALGRHILELDLETLNGLTLLGIAALMIALTAIYFLIRRRTAPQPAAKTAEPS